MRAKTPSFSLGNSCSRTSHCHSVFQPGLQYLQASQDSPLFWQAHFVLKCFHQLVLKVLLLILPVMDQSQRQGFEGLHMLGHLND